MFDPSQFAGLPLNVMALMPVLVYHFDQPTEFCIKVVSEIQQVHAVCIVMLHIYVHEHTSHFQKKKKKALISSITVFCLGPVQACSSVDLPSEESKTKMMHMSKMFQMYATRDFTNGCDIWLAGICRYLNDAYASIATKVHNVL